MKKILLLTAVTAAFLFAASCQKGVQGPTGPDGSGIVSAAFQNGAYPVSNYSGCDDVRIWDADPNFNYGTAILSQIGSYYGEKKRFLIKFDLSSLPVGAKIVSASLQMYMANLNGAQNYYSFRKVAENWAETQATWNSRTTGVSWVNASGGGDFYPEIISNTVTCNAVGAYVWNIKKEVVQDWINNASDNFGLIMTGDESVTAGDPGFATSESATTEYRPKLTVYYTIN